MSALAQIAERGTEPDPVVVVGDGRTNALRAGFVMVLCLWISCVHAGVVEGRLGDMPTLRVRVVHEYGAVAAMVFVVAVNVGF